MKKHKLVIFMPSIEGGGVEKNLFIISNFLALKIGKAIVITANTEYRNKFNKFVQIVGPNFNLIKKFGRKIKYFICLTYLFLIYLKYKKISVFAFQANMYAIIACKILGIKVITRSNSSPSGWSQNKFKLFFFKIILKLADKIIVNSLEFKNEMKKKLKIKTQCIYNPLNKKQILKLSKKKLNFSFFDKNKKKLKIINIGRYVEQKDQLTLLKALNLIKNRIDFRAAIVGKGVKEYELKNFISENNLKKKVKLLNFTNNPYKYLIKSDIFILSSIFEGLPNVVLEAITLRKLVISSSCPTGPKEILKNGKGGLLFKIKNFKELAKCIIYASKNKKMLNAKIKYSYKSLKRFDSYVNLNKYLNVVKKILNV